MLGALAPLGLALAAGSALVIDLDSGGPRYPGERSLADLVGTGLRRPDLIPRPGVAVLRNGGVTPAAAAEVVDALVAAHPTVVLRLPPRPRPAAAGAAVVPVRLLLPGNLYPWGDQPGVFQATPSLTQLPGRGVRLPVPRPITVESLLRGRRPPGRDHWVKAWAAAWRFPWGR
ncbi:MAG: hypothetical protein A2135_02625 [Actinobacteria bacterium RBG_16_67_15]|nr:MAG: hypothetical protein A2135_02625 [Actinobacteria bacterium RBG_16_67_15]